MHIDARSLENNSLIEGDICIIGAGAAGLSIALELMNTPYKVILLEWDKDTRCTKKNPSVENGRI